MEWREILLKTFFLIDLGIDFLVCLQQYDDNNYYYLIICIVVVARNPSLGPEVGAVQTQKQKDSPRPKEFTILVTTTLMTVGVTV